MINSIFFPPSSNVFSLQIPLEFYRITSPAKNELPLLPQYLYGLFPFLLSAVRSLGICVESSQWEWTLCFSLPLMQVAWPFFIYKEACYFFILCYVAGIQFPFPFNWTLAEQPLRVYKTSSEHQLCACEILPVGLTSYVALSPNSKRTFILGLKRIWFILLFFYSFILLRHLGVHFIH